MQQQLVIQQTETASTGIHTYFISCLSKTISFSSFNRGISWFSKVRMYPVLASASATKVITNGKLYI